MGSFYPNTPHTAPVAPFRREGRARIIMSALTCSWLVFWRHVLCSCWAVPPFTCLTSQLRSTTLLGDIFSGSLSRLERPSQPSGGSPCALHVGYQAAKKMQNGGCVDGDDEKMTMNLWGLFLRLRRKCRFGGCVDGGDEEY